MLRHILRLAGFLTLATLVASACSSTTAAPATDDLSSARDELIARVGEFNNATNNRDFVTVVGMLPPRILDELAGGQDMSRDDFVQFVGELTEASLEGVTIEDFEIEVPDDAPQSTESGLLYAIMPTTASLVVDGAPRAIDETTVAVYEDGEWSLSRLEGAPQRQLMRDLYPELADVDF